MRAPFRYSTILSALLILVLLPVYLLTLLHGPGDHPDTAKFQFVAYILGTPHAPGYPTYLVFTHFFVKLFPFGSLAYKVNLLSAIFSLCTCWILFRILLVLEVTPFIAFLTAFMFGLTQTFWSQSIIAEVYALNALFVALSIFFFAQWHLTRRDHFLIAACAIYAFSFGNHLTMVTFLPAIVFLVCATDPGVFLKPRLVVPIALLILLAALQYYYPLWRYNDPTTLYLDMQTPNLRKLIYAVTGGHFKSQMFAFSFSEILHKRIPMTARLIVNEYSFVIPLILFGICWFRHRVLQVFFLLSITGNIFWALNYNIPDIYVYFIPSYLLMAIYAGVGLQALLKGSTVRIVAPAACLIPVLFLFMNYNEVDQSRNTAGEQAAAILRSAGSRAVVFGKGRPLPKMYFFYYLYGEELYKKQLYVVKFTRNFLLHYVFDKRPYHVRELRRNIPPGLTIYCTTPEQKSLFQSLGFLTQRAGPGVYRVIATNAIHRPKSIGAEEDEEED